MLVLGAGLLACMMAGQQPSVHSPSSREYAQLGKGGYATNTRIAGLEASLTVRVPARPCLEAIYQSSAQGVLGCICPAA